MIAWRQFCRTRQVTPFIVLLAAFQELRITVLPVRRMQTIGSWVAGRNRQELEELIGFFVNLQCMRIKIHDESFDELVKQVQFYRHGSICQSRCAF